jgi:hypothetical protein
MRTLEWFRVATIANIKNSSNVFGVEPDICASLHTVDSRRKRRRHVCTRNCLYSSVPVEYVYALSVAHVYALFSRNLTRPVRLTEKKRRFWLTVIYCESSADFS